MRIAMNKLRVWQRANDVVLDNTRDRLIVWPHHPDQLRRPASRPGALHADNLQHALAWNVFRTLELLPPAFWLRRLQARLQSAQHLRPHRKSCAWGCGGHCHCRPLSDSSIQIGLSPWPTS